MPLGEFSIICFGFLSDFLEKITKRSKEKNWEKNGPLRRNKGHPRRGVALRCSEGCLAAASPKGQKGSFRLHCSVAMLCHSVAVLRRGVDTVHRGKILGFLF